MLKLNKLKISDVGREVKYIPRHANGDVNHPDCEIGKISSWNDRVVFVKYSDGDTGAATPPDNLKFPNNSSS